MKRDDIKEKNQWKKKQIAIKNKDQIKYKNQLR
jgi:hypothetical protein